MRLKLTGFLLFCAGLLSAGQHVNEVSGPVKDAGELEIVTEQPVPVVNYAAKELQLFLKQATGQDIPVVQKVSGNKTALILGDCPSAREAGIDVKQLPDEGYRILRQGNRVFIAGRDDPKQDPEKQTWFQYYPRATLSGIYDFLERFAGVRFFFPGQYGTVVPAKKGLSLPEKINILESPDMRIRSLYPGRVKSFDPQFSLGKLQGLTYQRLRLSDKRINFGHGLFFLNLIERFSKTHPEYFALRDDGKRYFEPWMQHTGQLCFNSGVREVVYQDAKAYFAGKPASSRGMKRWHPSVANGKYFCVMPDDAMSWCRCEKCREVCDPKKAYTPEGRQAISNFMFRFTAEIADRLTKDGIDCIVTQMVYPPYDMLPDCQIPKNVLLQVAVNGTVDENRSEDGKKLRDWNEKTGNRVSVWTYAMGKHMGKAIPGLPQMMPKEAARFITTYKDYLDGAYWESETEVYLFNYLNYYIVAKMMWNNSLDVNALLDDHYQTMFGKGAPMVKQVFEELEKCWVKGIINNTVMDEQGPRVQMPSDWEIWTKLYSPEKLARFEKLFDQAQRAAASDKGAVERLKFIRQQILGPLQAAQRKFQATQDALDSWRAYCPGSIWLRPYKGEVNEVNTRVDIAQENDELVFRFDCEEPRMNDLVAKHTGRDNPNTWSDSAMEIFINPSGDRKNYYHFIVNANGALTDYRRELNNNKASDIVWNSSATAKAEKGAAGWKAEVRIPLKDLGTLAKAIPVNFARHRALAGKPAVKEIYYQWSPQPAARNDGFHAVKKWGTLSLEKAPESLIPNGDFSQLKDLSKNYQEWIRPYPKDGQVAKLDNRIFIPGGQSLYFKNVAGKRLCAFFNIPGMKPKTKYQLSYYIKMKNVKGKSGAGTYLYFAKNRGMGMPRVALTGTYGWHRLTYNFTSPDVTGKDRIPILGLWIWFAEGEAWFDKVELIELK